MRSQAAFVTALGCVLLSLSIGASGAVWFIRTAEKPDHPRLSKVEEREAELVLKTQGETVVAPRVVAATTSTAPDNETSKQPGTTVVPDTLLTVTAQAPVTAPAPAQPLAVAQPAAAPEPAKAEPRASKAKVASASPAQKPKQVRRAVAEESDDGDEISYRRSNDYRNFERGTVVYRTYKTYRPAGGEAIIDDDD